MESNPTTLRARTVQGEPSGTDDLISPAVRRENPDPIAGNAPIPHWLIALCIAVFLLAGAYLSDPFATSDQPGINAESPAGPPDPMVLGKRVYSQNCSACHQPTGAGIPRLFPPLAGSEWVLGSAGIKDNHLVTILLHGLQGPIEVGGQSFNNAMPPWPQLSDDQIANVLTFIRTEWGNAATAIPADFVKSVREQTSSRTNPWSQKDLPAIAPSSAQQ